MKKALLLFAVFITTCSSILFAQTREHLFSGVSVGNPKIDGSTLYDEATQTYTLKGAGKNMWSDWDEFWFEHTRIKGDFILSANLEFVGSGVKAHRKIGLMIRSNSKGNSEYVDCCVHGDGLTGMQFREKEGGITDKINWDNTMPEFVQIERKGNNYIVRVSKNNQPLVKVAEKQFDLGEEVLAGMFICSHDAEIIETAKFWNVRLTLP